MPPEGAPETTETGAGAGGVERGPPVGGEGVREALPSFWDVAARGPEAAERAAEPQSLLRL